MTHDDHPETVAQRLKKPVQFLKGVGPRIDPLLQRLGLETAGDVLFHFPRSYEDLTRVTPIEQLQGSELACVCATVEEADLRQFEGNRSVFSVILRDSTGPLRAIWFNQPFMQQKLERGQRFILYGTPKRRGVCWEMTHPKVTAIGEDEEPTRGEMLPVYPSTEGLTQAKLRQIARHVVDEFADIVEEVFAAEFLAEHQLVEIGAALRGIHMPETSEEAEQARYRFVYQELLVLQLALAIRRWQLQQLSNAPQLPATAKIDSRIRRLFPFQLTEDQQQAIQEIAADMSRPIAMNRLLQGEVGSGKTVVAEYAMLLAVAHHCQGVIMAPTDVLARQHYRTLQEDLRQSRVRIELLTGSLTAAQKQRLRVSVRSGMVDLVIGTQALLHEDLEFPRLGLVVIDEQHKFGVRQRAQLKTTAGDPHYLVMTATPIPRTVTMSLFGDLDLSALHQAPPGRQKVHTYLGVPEQREQWWEFFRNKLRQGRQGYVITPRVEANEEDDLASVEEEYEQLVNGPLEAFRVDLIHGRMSPMEKETAMDAFRRGWTQVLVATSVIEVGVDVANATVMTIENGERFGLAQLHQLRGRVQRGKFPGYVCVFAQPGNPASQQRLEALARTNDGFELAEVDFALRGPGDLFGTRQHGLPPLRIADLQRDLSILERARHDAQQLLTGEDPLFFSDEFVRLRRQVVTRYGTALDLGDVA